MNPERQLIAVIDHHDSFTWNLVQLLETLGARCLVLATDVATPARVRELHAGALLFSPGPCKPEHAPSTQALIDAFQAELPLFGVCLGHQAMAAYFGGRLVRAKTLLHGKACWVSHDGRGLFDGLPAPLRAGRYNSWSVEEASLPEVLRVTAHSEDGDVMSFQHRELRISGVQFHPESILSECGAALLGNWLKALK
jgi:anthranilate synthase/aminodeoxychorismate synthase-like glutamine amidotransferase